MIDYLYRDVDLKSSVKSSAILSLLAIGQKGKKPMELENHNTSISEILKNITGTTNADIDSDIADSILGLGMIDENEIARPGDDISIADFLAYGPEHKYIYRVTREPWSGAAVRAWLPKVGEMPADVWLDRNPHQRVQQATWAPGHPEIIYDFLIDDGGWVPAPGMKVYNFYRPPSIDLGEAQCDPQRWIDLIVRLYGEDGAAHIMDCFACKLQRPDAKINHALVLGGAPGIGKDTLLEPLRQGVGPWNFKEAAPKTILQAFNPYLKSVVLRVNEAKDQGETNRYVFSNAMKEIIAAPPNTNVVNEKGIRQYSAPNIRLVVVTSNHQDALYLSPDDRRHYVLWSEISREEIDTGNYFADLWAWLLNGGCEAVVKMLMARDVSQFKPGAPPVKTEAWHAMMLVGKPPEEGDLANIIEAMGSPDATTLEDVRSMAQTMRKGDAYLERSLEWLLDPKQARVVGHRLRDIGYEAVANDGDKREQWKIGQRKFTIYARKELSPQQRVYAAQNYRTTRTTTRTTIDPDSPEGRFPKLVRPE
jgi:hypothetical protein